MDRALEVLHQHVERFNEGVRSGDFGPMLEAFSDHAELVFEGVPVGPFHGRDEIAAAYRERPPDDEIAVDDVRERDGVAVADYRWSREPNTRAGELRIACAAGRITRLVVTLDRTSA